MNNSSDTSPIDPTLADILADESLAILRKAYQAVEAVQLSPAHQSIKQRFQTIRTTQMNNTTQGPKTTR